MPKETNPIVKKVFKYEVNLADVVTLKLPGNAQVLHVDEQDGQIYLWALVYPNAADEEERSFRFAGTGHPIEEPLRSLKYINTFFMRGKSLVFHFFEILK